MNNKKAKKIATWIIVPLMASFFILDIITVAVGNHYEKSYMPVAETLTESYGDDRIHFLNTANSDCILLESNGHFALVDSGEGNNNPRRDTPYQGFEERVLDYLKKTAVKSDGKVHLDFILGTHYHYDHVGCFHSIITDNDIFIDKAFFKVYDPAMDKEYESDDWGLQASYDQIMSDLDLKRVEIVHDIPTKISFGDFDLTLYNTVNDKSLQGKGDNTESIGIKLDKNGVTAFLAADITGPSGLEKKLGKEIGHCDLLKVGHHGYFGSSSRGFLKYLTPKVAVVPNIQGKVYPNVKWNLTMYAHTPFYGTYDYNGIIATFTDSGEIKLTNNIH